MVRMDRYSSPTLSPDGRKLVFAKRVVDFDANRASTSLWIEDLFARDAAPPTRLTPDGWNVNSPAFSRTAGPCTSSARRTEARSCMRCRPRAARRSSHRPGAGCRRVQAVAGRNPHRGRVHGVPRLPRQRRRRCARLHQTAAGCGGEGERQGQRENLRPSLHPPLGHVGGRHAQPRVRGPGRRGIAGEDRGAGQRRRGWRHPVEAFRRPVRPRVVARRQSSR